MIFTGIQKERIVISFATATSKLSSLTKPAHVNTKAAAGAVKPCNTIEMNENDNENKKSETMQKILAA